MKHVGGLRYRICPDCNEMHDVHEWPDNHRTPWEVLSAPNVVRDEMDPVQGQHDGKMSTSKRAMRASYEPSGNAEGKKYIEIGNDPARLRPFKRPKPDRKGIKDAVQKAAARLRNGETTRETYERKVLTRPGPI